MEPLDLEAIRAREIKATKAPWWVDLNAGWKVHHGKGCDRIATFHAFDDKSGGGSASDNALFAAQARADIPALLAEVEELRAENERLRADLTAFLSGAEPL